jgi:DNA repair exonuclease SbcCD ATPase subunit
MQAQPTRDESNTVPENTENAEPTTQELLTRIEHLETKNEQLHGEIETIHEQQREDHHALARENHKLRRSNEQLQERVKETEAKRDELRNEIERAEASRGHIIEDIVDVEEQLADVEAESGKLNSENNAEISKRTEMIPIERISVMDTDETGIDVTPSIERAVSIFDHWQEWSDKTPKGRVLKSDLKTLLRTATGESLAWRQVYRAAEALDELSKGRIEFFDHKRHGKMLIESQPARSGDCHSSSAATT